MKVGKHTFRVERVIGVTVYLTKGKGQKLYTLKVVSLEPPVVVVDEVWGGSGDSKGLPPIAMFELD